MVFIRASSRLKPVPLIDRMRPVRPIRPNCGSCAVSAICCGLNCGTGFSRESVRCHTAYLMVFIRASSRLKPVPLMVRVHPVRPIRPNCGSCAVSAICCGLNCGTGFSRESVRCHTANVMVFMMASSRLKPVPLMVRVHPVRPIRPNCGSCAVSAICCGLNCGTGFSREGVVCHTAYLMVFMRASSRLKPVPVGCHHPPEISRYPVTIGKAVHCFYCSRSQRRRAAKCMEANMNGLCVSVDIPNRETSISLPL